MVQGTLALEPRGPVERIQHWEASAILTKNHYLGPLEYHPKYCLATPQRDALAVFSPPIPFSFKKRLPGCLEITRLWQSEDRRKARAERGPLSDFVKATLEWLKTNAPECPCVFSYTDPAQIGPDGKPHRGVVYQMARFSKLGPSRVTDYWLKDGIRYSSPVMYRRHKTKSREKLNALGYTLIEKPPKILYVFGLTLSVKEIRQVIGGRYA